VERQRVAALIINPMGIITRQLQPYTLEIRQKYQEGFEQWYLLSSDWHWDNPKCRRDLLKKHLEQAKDRGAYSLVFGDLFCAMQGKYDKRSDKTALRPEHATGKYLDSLVDTCADWLQPYTLEEGPGGILFYSYGNHETSILGRHETDLTERLCQRIGAQRGLYQGWIIFRFEQKKSGGGTQTFFLNYIHGYGGGGPVTKDTIQANRKAVYLPDADIVCSGHTHDRWIFPIQRTRIRSRNGAQYLREQLHIKTGNYKDEYSPGMGWAVGRGMPPKSLGAVWLRFYMDGRHIRYQAILTE